MVIKKVEYIANQDLNADYNFGTNNENVCVRVFYVSELKYESVYISVKKCGNNNRLTTGININWKTVLIRLEKKKM